MESFLGSSSQNSRTGSGGSTTSFFGMDPSKSRVASSVPKAHSKRVTTVSTSSKPIMKKEFPKVSSSGNGIGTKGESNINNKTSSSGGKSLGKTNSSSDDATALFRDLDSRRKDFDRRTDNIEFRIEQKKNIKSQDKDDIGNLREVTKKIFARKNEYDRDRDDNDTPRVSKSKNKSSQISSSQISSSSRSKYQPKGTRIVPLSESLQSNSDSEDEMTLGSTPPENMTEGYKEDRSRSNSPTKPPKSSHASSGKMFKKKKEIPLSKLDDVNRNLPTLKSKCRLEGHESRGKKRSSELEDEVEKSKSKIKGKGSTRRRIESFESSNEDENGRTPNANRINKYNKRASFSTSPVKDSSFLKIVEDQEHVKMLNQQSSQIQIESNRNANAFWEDLVKISSEAHLEEDETEDHIDVSKIMDEALEDDQALSEEDKAYLARFKSETDLCPYCSAQMPVKPSANLLRHKVKLEAVSVPEPTTSNPSARKLGWQQHIDFCQLHHAETAIIPLGIRSGYPEIIEFGVLEQKLETGWIRDELDEIVRHPEKSAVFRDVQTQIEQIGKITWGGIKWQSKPENLEAVKPGYFGELGRTILINHFMSLRKWGYYPSLKSSDPHHPPSLTPLSWTEFLSHVLIPEASILLIMSNKGATTFTEKAYGEAKKIRKESVTYGNWKFREDDEDSQEILATLHENKEAKKERLKRYRREKTALKITSSIEISSQTDTDEIKEESLGGSSVIEVQTPKPRLNSKVNEEGDSALEVKSFMGPTDDRFFDSIKKDINNLANLNNTKDYEDTDVESDKENQIHQPGPSQASTQYSYDGLNDDLLLEAADGY
ncbi:uncharacterized protein I206_102772 [Kwoniella pini CBS 10737]|uniref:Restriction of telomere capping protein 4 n=1 Tax=Kwoniella pini CBS 10737 TaxID=1296096 RepID=A0A1B9I6C0_9TREE|nr:uncharacterized protein I206_03127 [Kwoniella pini CBS 10737]OCF51062.1 hypothetical protein I206_03127 [Kwoniella pini CBS 10737]